MWGSLPPPPPPHWCWGGTYLSVSWFRSLLFTLLLQYFKHGHLLYYTLPSVLQLVLTSFFFPLLFSTLIFDLPGHLLSLPSSLAPFYPLFCPFSFFAIHLFSELWSHFPPPPPIHLCWVGLICLSTSLGPSPLLFTFLCLVTLFSLFCSFSFLATLIFLITTF